MNIPNQLTVARFGLALALFVVLYFALRVTNPTYQVYLLDGGLFLFVLAGITDFLDGHLARKWDMLTDFGRVADPLMDKIVVSGSFIFFLSFAELPLKAWMVVVIISREFVVNGLRGYAEAKGHKFGANRWGKMKMVCQCFTIFWTLLYLAHLKAFHWAYLVMEIAIWITIAITLWSGLTYVIQAKKLFSTIEKS